jgi:hypothetical protein
MNHLRLSLALTLLTPSIVYSGCRPTNQAQVVAINNSVPCSEKSDYFPVDGISGTGSLHFGKDQADWEGLYLLHMGEPSLFACGPQNSELEYRFLWDRSLSEPIAVRLVIHADGSGTLFVRVLQHALMLPPPVHGKKEVTLDKWLKVKLDKRMDLPYEQIQQVIDLFNRIEFPSENAKSISETTDGSDWIFESRVSGRYRLVDFRNTPSQAARKAGLFMVLDLAKVPIPQNAIY